MTPLQLGPPTRSLSFAQLSRVRPAQPAQPPPEAEQPLFGEPGMPAITSGWQRSLLRALFDDDAQASAAATTQFLSTAKVVGTGGDLALSFDYSKAAASASSYPNTLVTYEFVCTAGNKNGALLKSFLTYTSGSGQGILSANGYVPLPSSIQSQVQAEVAKIS